MAKQTKPNAYDVEKKLQHWLDNLTPLDMIDAKEMDECLYYFPNQVLKFYSSREQKLRSK